MGVLCIRAEPADGGAGSGLSIFIASLRAGHGEVGFKLTPLVSGQGGEAFPLKAAQQESPGNKVPTVGGVLPIGHEAHVLTRLTAFLS